MEHLSSFIQKAMEKRNVFPQATLISYDINFRHNEVKQKLIEEFGYKNEYFPNTVLIHENTRPDTALENFYQAITEIEKQFEEKIKVKSVIAVFGTTTNGEDNVPTTLGTIVKHN